MNSVIFFVSIILSSIGAFLDLYTTYITKKEGGIDLELNQSIKADFQKSKYNIHILYEAILIIIFGVWDSSEITKSLFLFGLVYLTFKGSVASSNLKDWRNEPLGSDNSNCCNKNS